MSHVIDTLYESNDLEAIERSFRDDILDIGNKAFAALLQEQANRIDRQEKHNDELKYCCQRSKQIHTLLGALTIHRGYYLHCESNSHRFRFDEKFGLGKSSYSPGAQRAISKLGAYLPFGFSDVELKELTGIDYGAKAVERITKEVGAEVVEYNKGKDKQMPENTTSTTMYLAMDGTGIPMTGSALAGRKGKQTPEAKTREVKLGCIFTQSKTGADNYPQRDEASTTYLGGIISAKELGERIYREAQARNYTRYRIAILGDGAIWIWNIATDLFPGAIQIVDLYHAREHFWNVAKVFFGNGSIEANIWGHCRKEELDNGDVEAVIQAISSLKANNAEQKQVQKSEIGYFQKNIKRMRYNVFRQMGLFVGSGVLEAGCKTLVGQRLKQSGMHWSLDGAESVIGLRCCIFSNQWEDFWEKRAAA